jgi:processive 1,2-diacylglycerol beta-glucosyltransferase
LVVSVSAGSGHVRAADALCALARLDFPDLSLRHRDLMQLVPAWFKTIYTDWYLKLASGLPEAWGWLYRKTDREPTSSLSGRFRRLIQRLCGQRLFSDIENYAPHLIICTHFLPAELLADALRRHRLAIPVWVVVTDFDVHQMWVHQGIAGYFVANSELAYRLQAAGIPESAIVVTGIPVMPGFTRNLQRDQCSRRWALDPRRVTLLMMGGGGGIGMSPSLIRSILAIDESLQIIVMTGKNQSLFQELNSLACFCQGRLVPLAFTDDVPDLMACADLVITKPGGLSTSECLAMGLPMLLINPIPGQEERNAALLLQEGVAQRADDEATLIYRLRRLLSDAETLSVMRSKTRLLAQPHAAQRILQHVRARLPATMF